MIRVLFAATPARWDEWRAPLETAFADAGLDCDLRRDHAPDRVDYIVYAPNGPVEDFAPYAGLKAVLNLWAGVEDVVGNPTLDAPLARMVDPGLTEGMVEYVAGHVLRHHLGIDRTLARQNGEWLADLPPLARARRVGVLGLGALGAAVAEALAGLNFDVQGWSRSEKTLPGIATAAGKDGLVRVLTHSEILVTLLPLTAETRGLIGARALGHMPRGAVLINPGRGQLIDDAALLAALETGELGHATLDVFETEPLPKDHPFWAHPGITVTPHIASATRPSTASRVIAENIRRCEAGDEPLHLVDRSRGY